MGTITVYLGKLEIEDVNVVAIVVPIAVSLLLILIAAILIVRWWKRRTKKSLEKKVYNRAYKPGNVRYVKRNGKLYIIQLTNHMMGLRYYMFYAVFV